MILWNLLEKGKYLRAMPVLVIDQCPMSYKSLHLSTFYYSYVTNETDEFKFNQITIKMGQTMVTIGQAMVNLVQIVIKNELTNGHYGQTIVMIGQAVVLMSQV